jgi:iron complex transport system permease protein
VSATTTRPAKTPQPPLVRVVRLGPASGRVDARAVAVCVVGIALLVFVSALSIGTGDFKIGVPDVLRVIAGGGDPAHQFIVNELRLPRVAVGLLVGLALGAAGAMTQTLARNPLASPDILGVTDGAAVGAVAVIVLGGTTGALATGLSAVGVTAAAFVGALAATVAVYLLAWRGGVDGTRLVLVGIGVGAILSALVSWMLTRARIWDAQAAAVWLTGSINGRGWEQAEPLFWALVVLLPLALAAGRTLRVMQLGDDSAQSLGVRLQRAQLAVLVIAVALTAFAVSAAGPIEFVAFVVPQIALRLAGASRPPILASAIYGALLVVSADLVARVVLPVELPVGIVTSAVGAPYLIWILVKRNREVSA